MAKSEKDLNSSAKAEQRRSLRQVGSLGSMPAHSQQMVQPAIPNQTISGLASPRPAIGGGQTLASAASFGMRQGPLPFPKSPANLQFPQSPANEQFPISPANLQFPQSPANEQFPVSPLTEMPHGLGAFDGFAPGQKELGKAQKKGRDEAIKKRGFAADEVNYDDPAEINRLLEDPRVSDEDKKLLQVIKESKEQAGIDRRAREQEVNNLNVVDRTQALGLGVGNPESLITRDTFGNPIPQDHQANQRMHDAVQQMGEHFGTSTGLGGSVGKELGRDNMTGENPFQTPGAALAAAGKDPAAAARTPEGRAWFISGQRGQALRDKIAARKARDRARRSGSEFDKEHANRLEARAEKADKLAKEMVEARKEEDTRRNEILDDPNLNDQQKQDALNEMANDHDQRIKDAEAAIERGVTRSQVETERGVQEMENSLKTLDALSKVKGQEIKGLSELVKSLAGLGEFANDPQFQQIFSGITGILADHMDGILKGDPEAVKAMEEATRRLTGWTNSKRKPSTGVSQSGSKPTSFPESAPAESVPGIPPPDLSKDLEVSVKDAQSKVDKLKKEMEDIVKKREAIQKRGPTGSTGTDKEAEGETDKALFQRSRELRKEIKQAEEALKKAKIAHGKAKGRAASRNIG